MVVISIFLSLSYLLSKHKSGILMYTSSQRFDKSRESKLLYPQITPSAKYEEPDRDKEQVAAKL